MLGSIILGPASQQFRSASAAIEWLLQMIVLYISRDHQPSFKTVLPHALLGFRLSASKMSSAPASPVDVPGSSTLVLSNTLKWILRAVHNYPACFLSFQMRLTSWKDAGGQDSIHPGVQPMGWEP